MSDRTAQVANVIRAEVQQVLSRGINDPRVRGLISVTKVDVTADLAEARVFVSILPEQHTELTMHGLKSAAGHIQREIAPSITMKRMPRLSFRLDDSLKKQAIIDAAIIQSRASGAAEPSENTDFQEESRS
jgi:ribosome-binding factor A